MGGIHASQISRFYRGERPLTWLSYDRLCEHFGLKNRQTVETAMLGGGKSDTGSEVDEERRLPWNRLAADESLWSDFREQLGAEDRRVFSEFILGRNRGEIATTMQLEEGEVTSTLARLRRYLVGVLRPRLVGLPPPCDSAAHPTTPNTI